MSWYSSPIQPIDPVVVSQTPKPQGRYMRDNFSGTGQNSYVKAPSQDQSMWQSLLNVQPITQGILNQRWGSSPFSGTLAIGASGTISTITSPGSFVPIGVVTTSSTAGLNPGVNVTISGSSDSFFNNTFVVFAVVSNTVFEITIPGVSAAHSGTGGTYISSTAIVANRLSNFQSDSLGTRAIIVAGSQGVVGLTEVGTIYNPGIFAPIGSGIIRSITSRNFQYFCDGNNALNPVSHRTGDSLKWNGAPTGGVTNTGILTSDVTTNIVGGGTSGGVVGPDTGTTAVDIPYSPANAWTSPAGIFTNSFGTAARVNVGETITITEQTHPFVEFFYNYSNVKTTSDTIQATGFFTAFPAASVAGLQVVITYTAVLSQPVFRNNCLGYVQLVKNGVVTGTNKNFTLIADGNPHTVTLGTASDLWGTSFSPTDITQSNFGLNLWAMASFVAIGSPVGAYNSNFQISVSYATITAFAPGSLSTTNSSGTGVGITSINAGGNVNLILGRTYYLVANTATVGHFSDLSVPSASTSAVTNADISLILATYNDPQVDTKYVLATPDGGDPSVLYEVSVLPVNTGFTITSWTINGSNQVTFTGTYNGAVFATGTQVTIVGLTHGVYMNGEILSVTSTTGTTFTATLVTPHAADSATEAGFGGLATFAIPNGTTAVIDNTPDPTLVLNQPLLYTDTSGNEFGVSLNDPPPAGNILIKHQGRLWMAGVPGASHSVFFSKSVTELTLPDGFIAGKYEESWPGTNYFDVSDGAESVSGLLTDGTTLYIGTQSHIRRLIGNSLATFQEPAIVHPEVGLINQEVWQLAYMQGAPSGSIWMTPDFRVIQSDFNTYVDIGTPVQDILNSLQPTAQTLAHGQFVADGEYELYILAVPYLQSTYCDTHLIFDLRARQWFVWQPAGGSLSVFYNITQNAVPQWLFITGTGTLVNIYNSAATTDSGTVIPVTATTTWMHLGEPTRRKLLNEVQVYGNTAMTMNVYGSNNLADFTSPRPVVYNRPLRQSPFGTWNLYLTGTKTKHRYYQFTFTQSNGQIPFVGSYAVAFTPMDDL